MNADSAAHGADIRPYRAAPKMGLRRSLRIALSDGNGRNNMRSHLEALHAQLGPVIRQRVGIFSFVNLLGPEANRLVLTNRGGIFSNAIPWNMIIGKLFTNGLMLKDGADHRRHRIIMQEAFKPGALRAYAGRMNPMIAAGIADWGSGDMPRPMYPAYKQLTLEMAASIFMGEELGDDTRKVNKAFERMVAASMSLVRLNWKHFEYGRGIEGRRVFVNYLSARIGKKRGAAGEDMFSRLCHATGDEGATFTDEEIVDHMVFLMMAAHDTTTSTLSSMTYLLAKHPEWQERLREECLALGSGPPGLEAQDALRDMMLVLKETLRMYPPLPTMPRVATEAFEFGGYEIPAGTMVQIAPIFTHYMPGYWTRPEQFDPERFAPGRAEHERHSHQWIPFGGGAHVCLGMRFAETQIRLVMHQLLTRYRFEAPEGYIMPVQEAPISKPRDGLPLRVVPLGPARATQGDANGNT